MRQLLVEVAYCKNPREKTSVSELFGQPATFTVQLGNLSPGDARTDATQRRDVWQEAAAALASSPAVVRPWSTRNDTYLVEIDASDVLYRLSTVAAFEKDSEPLHTGWANHEEVGLHPFTSRLELRLTPKDVGTPDLRLH